MTAKNDTADILPDRQPSVRVRCHAIRYQPDRRYLWRLVDVSDGPCGRNCCGTHRAKGRTATVFVDSMSFLRPVHVGDEVSFFTEIIHVGAHPRFALMSKPGGITRFEETSDKVTEGVFTFVALDEAGRPPTACPRSGRRSLIGLVGPTFFKHSCKTFLRTPPPFRRVLFCFTREKHTQNRNQIPDTSTLWRICFSFMYHSPMSLHLASVKYNSGQPLCAGVMVRVRIHQFDWLSTQGDMVQADTCIARNGES